MKKIITVFITLSLMLFIGCTENKKEGKKEVTKEEKIEQSVLPEAEDKEEESKKESSKAEEESKEESSETKEVSSQVEESSKPEEKEEKVIVDGVVSKLTGLMIEKEVSKKRPIVVMLDNHYKARPQAGISEADIVYEILAEGLITRYMAVFQTNEPSIVGPVRSSRPYYIKRALEYNPLYVHVGGSMQALTDIINYQMADIDGLSSGIFKRKNHKKMPHNAYVSLSSVRKEASRKRYYKKVEFAGLPISDKAYDLDGKAANEIKIYYKQPSSKDSVGYSIKYKYNEEKKQYIRYVNDKRHLDENDDKEIIADNIIIQVVNHKVIDKEGRRKVSMIGSGKGKYINKGKVIDITWKKESKRAMTKFYTGDKELILNPGKTWIQVISPGMKPRIK